ncbi:TPA: hypothetical protein R1156_000977 [Yersinia enterocolitica]|nr:hypothetical protein [Yersinia enterocolitica]
MDLIPNSDIYSYSSTRCSWEAWQASREIIVLDLPEPGDYDYITQYAESVYMEIRTAGIRIKGESE